MSGRSPSVRYGTFIAFVLLTGVAVSTSAPARIGESAGAGMQPAGPVALAASSAPQVWLPFDAMTASQRLSDGFVMDNRGASSIGFEVLSLGGGSVGVVDDGKGGRALRLPSHGGAARAYLATTKTSDLAGLTPRWRDFAFSARFNLDQTSSGSASDNGDNLIQRGLWNTTGQYKIELDRSRVTCRVKGAAGAVQVTNPKVIQRGQWHTARCERSGGKITVVVTSPNGERVKASRTGKIGDVAFPQHIKLSAGGKVGGDGKPLASASDQFNGAIDNIHVRVE